MNPVIECQKCRQQRTHKARGLCASCYKTASRAGRLDEWVLPDELRADKEEAARKRQPCGTWAAYQRHRAAGEEPCEACREGARRFDRAGAAKRRQRLLEQGHGTVAGYRRHRVAGQKPCSLCAAAFREPRTADIPKVVQGPDGCGPCVMPENGRLWDPRDEDESRDEAQRRFLIAQAICLTQCPVLGECRPPRGAAGVVAGRLGGAS